MEDHPKGVALVGKLSQKLYVTSRYLTIDSFCMYIEFIFQQ